MPPVDLSQYDNRHYQPDSPLKRALWYITSTLFVNTFIPFPSSFKVKLIKTFRRQIAYSRCDKTQCEYQISLVFRSGRSCLGRGRRLDQIIWQTS